MAIIIDDRTMSKPKPEGSPWTEKIITLENATDEPLSIHVRYTSKPAADVTDHYSWDLTGEYKFHPGERAYLTHRDKPVSAVKMCIRFDGDMTKRSNVPSMPRPKASDWSLFAGDLVRRLMSPQIVVCGAPYDAPKKTQFLYICKF